MDTLGTSPNGPRRSPSSPNNNAPAPLAVMSLVSTLKTTDPEAKTLQELRVETRGNVAAKCAVYEQLGDLLVKWLSHEDSEVRCESAMLFRMITSCREVKITEAVVECIVKILEKETSNLMKISLAATIRNLAVTARHRIALVNANALNVLALHLQNSDDSESVVIKEVAGALRNLSLDENQQEEFATPLIVNALTKGLASDDEENLEAICAILSNISLCKQTRKSLLNEDLVSVLAKVLTSASSKTLLFALATYVNLAIDGRNPILENYFTVELSEKLIMSRAPRIKEATYALLDFFSEENGEATSSSIEVSVDPATSSNKTPTEKKENDVPASTQEVLKQLNLEESIKSEDLTLTKRIGEGQYGDVWMGLYHSYPVAIKVIKKEMTSQDALKALDELKFMSKLKHPNVVLLMGACCNQSNQIMIVTEFASRGDLRGCISGPDLKSLSMRLKIGLDIASGLAWLASHGIVHRDLKLPNLLVFDDWTVKVGDFGLSLQLKEGQIVDRFGGNVKYSAPEILRARYNETQCEYAYSEKTDVYSFGLMLWELISLKPLFVRPKGYAGKKGLAKYVLDGHRPPLDKPWVPSMKKLLTDCWHEDPNQRPLFRDIIVQWPGLTNEVLCPDQNGLTLVKRLWTDSDQGVPLDEFRRCFGDTCLDGSGALDSKKNQGLNQQLISLLCENSSDDIVTKKRFCSIVGWFSPIDKKISM